MFESRSRTEVSKRPEGRHNLCCWLRAKRGISLELQIQDRQYCLVVWIYKEKLFKQGKGSCELTLQESSSCCCLILEVTYKDNTQVIYTLGRIWTCILAGLALLDVTFPTTSPSGDQVLQSFQQVYFISNPKMEEMSENSLKSPRLLQAVLGPLLRCGCTCASLPWGDWSWSGIA